MSFSFNVRLPSLSSMLQGNFRFEKKKKKKEKEMNLMPQLPTHVAEDVKRKNTPGDISTNQCSAASL